MKPKILMILSAVFLAAIGLAMLFAPDRVLGVHGTESDAATALLIQMSGALYLGFAILNWTARGVMTSGVYSRLFAQGNFLHFAIVAILLIDAAIVFGARELAFSATVYSAFAVWFGVVLLRPSREV